MLKDLEKANGSEWVRLIIPDIKNKYAMITIPMVNMLQLLEEEGRESEACQTNHDCSRFPRHCSKFAPPVNPTMESSLPREKRTTSTPNQLMMTLNKESGRQDLRKRHHLHYGEARLNEKFETQDSAKKARNIIENLHCSNIHIYIKYCSSVSERNNLRTSEELLFPRRDSNSTFALLHRCSFRPSRRS